MKPTFKTTAVAILVALGVTACGSDPKSNPAPQTPNPINTPKKDDTAKKQQEEEAKKKAEADKKAKEEQERLTAEQKAKEEADKKAREDEQLINKRKAEEEYAKQIARKPVPTEPSQPTIEQKRESVVKARQTGANIYSPSIKDKAYKSYELSAGNNFSMYSQGVINELRSANIALTEPVHTPANETYFIDYKELASQDNKNPNLLGLHSGSINSSRITGSVVTKTELDSFSVITRSEPHKVDYLFKNTPYSTYGVIYNDYAAKLFVSGEDNWIHGTKEVVSGNTVQMKYNDAVKGSATYTGDIIAVADRYQRKGIYLNQITAKPKVDGSITVNANFGEKLSDNYVSANIHSNTIGHVQIPKSEINTNNFTFSKAVDYDNAVNALRIEGAFVGPNAREVIGTIQLDNQGGVRDRNGEVSKYKAVFGAEKSVVDESIKAIEKNNTNKNQVAAPAHAVKGDNGSMSNNTVEKTTSKEAETLIKSMGNKPPVVAPAHADQN